MGMMASSDSILLQMKLSSFSYSFLTMFKFRRMELFMCCALTQSLKIGGGVPSRDDSSGISHCVAHGCVDTRGLGGIPDGGSSRFVVPGVGSPTSCIGNVRGI